MSSQIRGPNISYHINVNQLGFLHISKQLRASFHCLPIPILISFSYNVCLIKKRAIRNRINGRSLQEDTRFLRGHQKPRNVSSQCIWNLFKKVQKRMQHRRKERRKSGIERESERRKEGRNNTRKINFLVNENYLDFLGFSNINHFISLKTLIRKYNPYYPNIQSN